MYLVLDSLQMLIKYHDNNFQNEDLQGRSFLWVYSLHIYRGKSHVLKYSFPYFKHYFPSDIREKNVHGS